jgi:HPt (histidine-containing phosphotransfer) domain-containing protein
MTRETLRGLVASIVSEPVVSALAHDVALTPLIDQFVGRLRQQARQLSAAFERGESEAVKRIVRTLQGDAGSYGFDPISEEAEHLQVLLELDAPPAQLRGAVYELIHLCRAARPATWETGDPGPDAGSAAASDRTLAI